MEVAIDMDGPERNADAAVEKFSELDEGEVARRTELYLEKFQEREGREMADREFHDFLHCWTSEFVSLDVMANEVFSEQFWLAASVMEATEQL